MTTARGGTELMADRINSLPPELLKPFQIIHSRVREIDSKKKQILVLHDLAQDPEVQHLRNGGWEKFETLVFVSHWQQQQYNLLLGVPFEAGVVLQNAVSEFDSSYLEKPHSELNLIYFSTPHRGLNILLAAFNELSKDPKYNHVKLKIYSSFGLYGWQERDKPYQGLFDFAKQHPKIFYSGAVSNDVIREELRSAHILAYPSTWQETSCLCLIEAMCAGLTCVHSSLAALPETSMGLTSMYGYVEDTSLHGAIFLEKLKKAIDEYQYADEFQSAAANWKYSWNNRSEEWIELLSDLS